MKIKPLKNTKNLIITYTIAFGILAIGVFALFIINHKTFVNTSDAYDQGYFWTVEMKKNLASLFAGDGYPLWSWARGLGMDLKPPIDPFMIIAALFPVGYVELGYTIAILLRMYCAGLAFIAFAGEAGLDNYKRFMGAICYVFSSWVINLALVQGQYVDVLILFPLLVMGVDRVYKKKSPAMFIAAVAICVAINYYLAFMAALVVILYILVRYFNLRETFRASEYIAYIGKFVLYGILGIMIAAFFVLVSIKTIMGASTGSGTEHAGILEDLKFYLEYPLKLLSQGYSFTYGYIGIPIFALLTVILSIRKGMLKRANVIVMLVLFVLSLMPIASSVMNGLGYVTTRWYFTFVFFIVWAAVENMDFQELCKTRSLLKMGAWLALFFVCVPGFAFLNVIGSFDSKGAAVFVCGNLLAGIVILAVLGLVRKGIFTDRSGQVIMAGITVFALIVSWNCTIYGNLDDFCRNNEINSQLEKSTQRAGAEIDDDGFYRIDQVDGINVNHNAAQPANENIWWGTNTLYSYDSKTPARLSEFNRLVGNNYGYSKRVYVQSNGNRMGLDYLYGVKYFLGDDTRNGTTGADEYAGYGFSYMDNVDGVNVFRNKYGGGLGFAYGKYISESEFLKLDRLEREQALLQAVVLSDEDCARLRDESSDGAGIEVKAKDIDTDIENIDYEFGETCGVELSESGFHVDKLDGDSEDAWFEIEIDSAKNCQLVVSFDNLQRLDKDGNPKGNFYIRCDDGKVSVAANNYKNNQTISGIVDYDFNLGYKENFSGTVRIELPKAGTYTYDRLYVSAMSVDNYDKYAKKMDANRYNVTSYDDRGVKGTVNAKKDGFLFISMPNYSNWNVYIDGEKHEKISGANIAFFATEIDKGAHEVTLKYDFAPRIAGLLISLAGLLVAVIICLIQKRRSRKSERQVSIE